MKRRRHGLLFVGAIAVAALGVVACGSEADPSGDASSGESTASTDAASGESTTSTSVAVDPMPTDLAAEVEKRLTAELGDAELAQELVGGLEPEALERLGAAVPITKIATTPVLAYEPDRASGPVDHLVVLAFGNRVAADGIVTAGPTNEALADAVERYVADDPTPVYAQWEVAEILQARKVPDVVSIEPQVGADGETVYLSTAGVTDEVVRRAEADGVELGTVGVVGFADHVVRCVATAEASGMTAVVPEDIELPSTYDPESGQEWTRDRPTYLATDLASRIAGL